MLIVCNVDAEAVGGPRAVATIARGFLCGVILQNRILIRRGLVPSLYGAFREGLLSFQAEPNAGKFERFDDALVCIERGWGDCDDLVAWRCAELQELKGRRALPKIYWRMRDAAGNAIDDERRWREAATTAYHAEVRIPCRCHQGRAAYACERSVVEDVSAFLGMARRATRRGQWADKDRVA